MGSAVSGLIAAGFVLISGSYQYVFFFAIVPYAFNLINFAGYPAELDGDHAKATTLSETVTRLKGSFGNAFSKPALRRIILESMGWGGFFGATKDYLQPVLKTAAILSIAFFLGQTVTSDSPASTWLNEARTSALLIGPVYALLFLMSAWASRQSHRLVEKMGGESAASRRLWLCNALAFVALGVFGAFGSTGILIVAFVSLHILTNFWRPILISRFDTHSSPEEGATILSIESQAQRTATFMMAPAIGWAIDHVRQVGWGGEYWPIGLIGGAIAIWMYASSPRSGVPESIEATA
jgi:hypothetical protein